MAKGDGIACPNCGEMEEYKSHNSAMKKTVGKLTRRKVCKCGQVFETIEVLVGPVEIKTRT